MSSPSPSRETKHEGSITTSSTSSSSSSSSSTTTSTPTSTPVETKAPKVKELPRDLADPDGVASVTLKVKPADPRYEQHQVEIQVSPRELTFGLKPTHCGPKVIYMNAQDVAFYSRRLANPKYTCWILCKLVCTLHPYPRFQCNGF